MEVAHDTTMSGHLGAKKTSDRVLANFYWPGILDEINGTVRHVTSVKRRSLKEK